MGRLEDRVAIITGAGQGIGLAYAERFLQEGAKVVVAEINEDRARSAMTHLEGKGEVEFVQTDISDEQSALDCATKTRDHFGKVDILVNNAALYYDIDNERNDYDYLRTVFSVNLHGAWLMARACAPHMVEQHRGRIINQSSGAAYMYSMVPPGDFHEVSAFNYSQTKWGVVGLTKFLAGQQPRVLQAGHVGLGLRQHRHQKPNGRVPVGFGEGGRGEPLDLGDSEAVDQRGVLSRGATHRNEGLAPLGVANHE